jgi:hypothetical protein
VIRIPARQQQSNHQYIHMNKNCTKTTGVILTGAGEDFLAILSSV